MEQTFTNTQSIQRVTRLEVAELDGGLAAYRQTTTMEVLAEAGDMKVLPDQTHVREGIVDAAELMFMLEGEPIPTNDWLSRMVVMSPEDIEHLRTQPMGEHYDIFKRVRRDFYTALIDEKLPLDQLVNISEMSNFILFDRHGVVLPTSVYLGYIRGAIDAGHYDLEKVAEHLLKRSDVHLYVDSDTRPNGKVIAETVEEAIFNIPYYNADEENGGRAIQLLWMPSQEDFARVFDACGKTKHHVPEMLLKLDILEIAQFRLAKTSV